MSSFRSDAPEDERITDLCSVSNDSDEDTVEIIGQVNYPVRWIISVDVGYRNLGLAVYDAEVKELVFWDVVDLAVHSFNGESIAAAVQVMFERYISPLVPQPRRCQAVIEKQVPHPRVLKVLMTECALRGFLMGKDMTVITVDPKAVKKYFSISGQRGESYGAGKRRAIEHVSRTLETGSPHVRVPAQFRLVFERGRKKDDMADAFLHLKYVLMTS